MYSQKQENGKMRFFEKFRDPLTGKQKTVSVVLDKDTSRTRKQAAAILQDKIRERITAKDECDITLQELTERFLKARADEVKPSTMRRWKWLSRVLIELLGGSVKVTRLTAKHVYSCLDLSDYNAQNKNIIMSAYKALIRWAYRHDLVSDINYLEKLEPYKEDRIDKIAYLEQDELQAVIETINKQKWKDLTLFLALTGMRIGEALALTIDDIDGDIIRISKTVDETTGEVYDTPKTKDSNRQIYIQAELVPLIKKLRLNALACSLINHDRSLFQDENGKCKYPAYQKAFKQAVLTAANKDLSVHSLRHTHTSLLAEQGVPLDVISRRLGHADSDITKKVYYHVTSRQKEKDAEIIKNISIL